MSSQESLWSPEICSAIRLTNRPHHWLFIYDDNIWQIEIHHKGNHVLPQRGGLDSTSNIDKLFLIFLWGQLEKFCGYIGFARTSLMVHWEFLKGWTWAGNSMVCRVLLYNEGCEAQTSVLLNKNRVRAGFPRTKQNPLATSLTDTLDWILIFHKGCLQDVQFRGNNNFLSHEVFLERKNFFPKIWLWPTLRSLHLFKSFYQTTSQGTNTTWGKNLSFLRIKFISLCPWHTSTSCSARSWSPD